VIISLLLYEEVTPRLTENHLSRSIQPEQRRPVRAASAANVVTFLTLADLLSSEISGARNSPPSRRGAGQATGNA
jgi:hypothetical protein